MTEPYDRESARANAGDSEEVLEELIDVFREECTKLMGQIRGAIEQSDAEELRRAAHTLKGSAQQLAADPLAEAALEMETFGHKGDFTAAQLAHPALESEAQRLLAALDHRAE